MHWSMAKQTDKQTNINRDYLGIIWISDIPLPGAYGLFFWSGLIPYAVKVHLLNFSLVLLPNF